MQKCSIALCLVPAQQSLLPPMVGFVGPEARVLPESSYVIFHLSTTRNPDQADDQPFILHVPGINGVS
jgi:hypothetical protein